MKCNKLPNYYTFNIIIFFPFFSSVPQTKHPEFIETTHMHNTTEHKFIQAFLIVYSEFYFLWMKDNVHLFYIERESSEFRDSFSWVFFLYTSTTTNKFLNKLIKKIKNFVFLLEFMTQKEFYFFKGSDLYTLSAAEITIKLASDSFFPPVISMSC